MDAFQRTTLVLLVLAFLVVIMCAVFTYEINAYNTAYAPGNPVETTADYTNIFGDSFSGHIICSTSFWDRMVTVRNADGVERVFAAEWLEPVEPPAHPNT